MTEKSRGAARESVALPQAQGEKKGRLEDLLSLPLPPPSSDNGSYCSSSRSHQTHNISASALSDRIIDMSPHAQQAVYRSQSSHSLPKQYYL